MFDKIAATFSAIALAAAGYAVFQTGKMASTVSQSAALNTPVSGQMIEEYIRNNPAVVIASLERYQIEQQESQQRLQKQADVQLVAEYSTEIFEDGYSFIGGNPDGDITLVEFSDYNCGFCKRAHNAVADFVESDGNVRLVIKEFPILGDASTLAGRAALASSMQSNAKKYESFNDALMRHRGSHNSATIMQIAQDVGLDTKQLQIDMDSPKIDTMIRRTFELADKLSINGTPAFVIGNQVVRGFVPAEELQRLAAAARAG